MVPSRVAASSAAWGWQSSESTVTIPKSFGFEAATHYRASKQCFPKSELFEPCLIILEIPHPLGPAIGQRAAGECPGSAGVELAVPFQRPQLFDPHFAHGEIAIGFSNLLSAIADVWAEDRVHSV